jgi:hypothetical protein
LLRTSAPSKSKIQILNLNVRQRQLQLQPTNHRHQQVSLIIANRLRVGLTRVGMFMIKQLLALGRTGEGEVEVGVVMLKCAADRNGVVSTRSWSRRTRRIRTQKRSLHRCSAASPFSFQRPAPGNDRRRPTPHSSRPSKRCATLVGSRIMKSDGICLRHRSDKFEGEVRAIHSTAGIAQHVRWAGFRSI